MISSTHQVEIVDNIIDLKTNGSDCDDVNRRNFIHHQQMISSNRESFKTMLSPTTPTDVSTFVPIDNVPKANQNVKRTSQQRVLENEILHDTTRKELSAYSQQIRLEETQKPQQGIQKFSANHTNKLMNPNELIDSYIDDNATAPSNLQILNSRHQITNISNSIYEDSPPHLSSNLEANNTTNFSILNQLHSVESPVSSGSANRSCQGTYSSMSGGTGSSVSHLDSVSDHSNSLPPSAGQTATPSSVTSYSCGSSAMMMSPGSSTASSSEHSASGGNGGVRSVAVSNTNAKYTSSAVTSGSIPTFQGEISVSREPHQDQIITAVNAGRIRKNLSEYSVSGIDNRMTIAASTLTNINQNNADTSALKDTKIEIAGRETLNSNKKLEN